MPVLHEKETIGIEEEIQKSYLDYAMSVIVGRALPDVRDGLKPVHRRILYSMYRAGYLWNRQYYKCARVVGDVIGQYHPHGDQAVYDSVVRMAQPFSMRHVLIDGQGNFGSVDGDSPAAMRYTEARLHKICQVLLEDLDKQTVDFMPNYDNTLREPVVLPARFPVLLVEGSQGIAVGMATNIPPHNLGEVIDATIHLVENPDATVIDLMNVIPGPDFPTSGSIMGRQGIIDAYTTGRGTIRMRATAEIEDAGKGYERIIVTEIPYLVNKARMVEASAELVKNKTITGIRDIRDESDRRGMRVVFELKRDENPEVILNQLYRHTQLQTSFGIQLLCVDNGRPKQMSLKEVLGRFIEFRKEVVIRRTQYELNRARERAHILEGLKIALDNIDEVIAIIRGAENPAAAKESLMEAFGLSEVQAQAILDMRLQRLTGLERDKILQELKELLVRIGELEEILASEAKILEIIVRELKEVKGQFANQRRTAIIEAVGEMEDEDFIPRSDVVVTFSSKGYVKRVPANLYKAQRPGGRGRIGTRVGSEDVVSQILFASSHGWLLCFSNRGRIYWLRPFQLPEESPYGRGRAIINLLKIDPEERIKKILVMEELGTDGYIVMVSAKGKIKKTAIKEFSRPRPSGLIALSIDEDDELVDVNFTTGQSQVLLATRHGKAIRFHEDGVRPMGRQARGVNGVRMKSGDVVIGMEVIGPEGGSLLTITESGFGKRTDLEEYPVQNRGGQGVINIKNTARNGDVVGILLVEQDDHVLILTTGGRIIRLNMEEISVIGRNTMGRTMVRMGEGEKVVDMARAEPGDEELPGEELQDEEAPSEPQPPGEDTDSRSETPQDDAQSDAEEDEGGSSGDDEPTVEQ